MFKMRTAAKIDLTNGMVVLSDGSKKTMDNYILELEDRFIKLQEVLLKQKQEIDQLKAREKEHQRLNGELREENERLNSIINKTIYSVQEHYDNSYSVDDVNDIGSGTYDDLMEILKGE
jgi:vacuolar-type H+-ATPase subunit I/STV1